LVTAGICQDTAATVRLQGRALFRVGPAGDLTAEERAAQIERRLERLLSSDSGPGKVVASRTPGPGNARSIRSGEAVILTVTESDAEENLQELGALAEAWAAAINTALDQASRADPSSWRAFVVRIGAAFRTAFGRLLESAAQIVPGALAALIVVVLFWGIAAALRFLLRRLLKSTVDDRTSASLIKQVVYYSIWLIGILVAAGALGFEPGAVITGLGLTSLALGFALKDILSNFVSGMLLLVLRPFELGDQIVVGDTEGTVERIELRATQIRTYDGRVVYVPNADIFTSRLINNTAAPVRRASILLPLGYNQDLATAWPILLGAVQSRPGVLDDPPVLYRVRELGASDIVVELSFWTDSRRSDFAATTSSVREAIVRECRKHGIGLPDPALRVIQHRDPS
jgi:small conductance mechanosensitive channel